MKRKLLSALLCLALCASLLPAALAEEDFSPPRQFYDPDTMLWGLKEYMGDGIILPAEYDYIYPFRDSTAIVQKNTDTYGSTFGLVDYNGSFILPVEYSDLSRGSYDESDNILRARKREEDFYRYLRPDGTPLTDYTFTECSDFCRHIGVGCRIIDGKALYGAVNDRGEILIPFEYDSLSDPWPSYYSMEWLSAQKDGCCGAFDYNGNLLRRCIYPDNVLLLQSLSLPAQMTGEEELSHLISSAQSWEVAHAPYDATLWGYSFQRDTAQGTETCWAIYPQFLSAQPFDETGHAQVTDRDGRVGTIDQSGNFTPAVPNGYEQAVIDLRSGFTYMEESEKTYETPECTVFVYDRGGAMYAPLGNVTLIYKPGSALGEGTTIRCPIPNPMSDKHREPPELMDLSEDGKTFTYTYYYEDHVHTCTVDLPSGKTTESDGPLTYENQMAFMTQSTGYTVDQRLDGPTATVVARHRTRSYWSREEEREVPFDDYELYLLSQGQNAAHRLVLPSTAYISGYYGAPTDRLPDSMYFSEDGKTFTYTYSFDVPLSQPGGEVLHEAGDYIYTVNVATGEVSASIDPLSQLSLSFYALDKTLRNEEGYQFEHVEAWGDSATALLRFKAASPNDPQKRDYELYLLRRTVTPQLLRLPLPSTEVLPDGSAPTTAKPDTLQFSSDGSQLAYTYRFPQPLWSGDTLLHDKGTYTYMVDVATGGQSVVLEDSYWKALADLTWNSDDRPFQLERQLETEACTIVLGMTKAIQYPRAILALVYKEGSAKGSGEVVYLPTLSGSATHDSMAPHSLSLNEEKTVLTYTYQFDEDFKATRPPGGFYFVSHKAGTYTYVVDLTTGEVTDTFVPKE